MYSSKVHWSVQGPLTWDPMPATQWRNAPSQVFWWHCIDHWTDLPGALDGIHLWVNHYHQILITSKDMALNNTITNLLTYVLCVLEMLEKWERQAKFPRLPIVSPKKTDSYATFVVWRLTPSDVERGNIMFNLQWDSYIYMLVVLLENIIWPETWITLIGFIIFTLQPMNYYCTQKRTIINNKCGFLSMLMSCWVRKRECPSNKATTLNSSCI